MNVVFFIIEFFGDDLYEDTYDALARILLKLKMHLSSIHCILFLYCMNLWIYLSRLVEYTTNYIIIYIITNWQLTLVKYRALSHASHAAWYLLIETGFVRPISRVFESQQVWIDFCPSKWMGWRHTTLSADNLSHTNIQFYAMLIECLKSKQTTTLIQLYWTIPIYPEWLPIIICPTLF